MSTRNFRILDLVIYSVLSLLFAACYGRTPSIKTGLEGKPMPNIPILLSDSSTVTDLQSIERNSDILLFYYSPKCPYCKAEIEGFLANKDVLKKIQILLVTDWPIAEIKKFNEEYKLSENPNYISAYDYTGKVGNYFNLDVLPYNAIFQRNNLKVVFKVKKSAKQIKQALSN
jgi:peroxiredoxin